MASTVSSIESHPMRQRIVAALAQGQTLRQIIAWAIPPVTTGSLTRFRRHALADTAVSMQAAKAAIATIDNEIAPVVSTAVIRASLTAAVDPFLAHAIKGTARRERWMESVEAAPDGPDYRALAALDRNDLSALELHARLAGRLDAPSPAGTTFVLMPLMQVQPAAADVARVISAEDVVFGETPEPAPGASRCP